MSVDAIRQEFENAKTDHKPVGLPGGTTVYLKPLSISDVREVEQHTGDDGDIDLEYVFRKIFQSLHDEDEERVFADDEIDGLLDIPFNHPLMEAVLEGFNDANDMSLDVTAG